MSAVAPILEANVEERRKSEGGGLSVNDFFEILVASELCKHRHLSHAEIERGIVDGADDGGIDAVYVFVNGRLIEEDYDLSTLAKENVRIEILLCQAKWKNSAEETVIIRQIDTLNRLLDVTRPLKDSKTAYNAAVISAFSIIRDVCSTFNKYLPAVNVRIVYAYKGDEGVNPKCIKAAEECRAVIKNRVPLAVAAYEFMDATALVELFRERPASTLDIVTAQPPMSSVDGSGYICLVRLDSYYKFITTSEGDLRVDIFEANVRDYQGENEVNGEIKQTLQRKDDIEFWWLNNGITIVAEKAAAMGHTISLTTPSIVNGLQTSNEIFNQLSVSSEIDYKRHLLVRVIVTEQSEVADRIIKATNRQTSIPYAFLRATEPIHRNIEEFIKKDGMYYDRRKNHYRNIGIDRVNIITIGEMAQAVAAILLQRPNDARARPSSLLKSDDDYGQIFNAEYPVELFAVAAKLYRRVTDFLQTLDLGWRDKNNVRFHVMMVLAAVVVGKAKVAAGELASVAVEEIEDGMIAEIFDQIWEVYKTLGASDAVAKGAPFATAARGLMPTE